MAMILGTRVRRGLVVGLIAAGWLSILGNSPGPEYNRKTIRQTGDITITLAPGTMANACHLSASVATPVRRFGIYNGADVIRELSCVDGSNCLVQLPFGGQQPCAGVLGA